MSRADLSILRKPFCLFLLGAAFVLTLLFLAAEIQLLRNPSQRDYGEGFVLCLTDNILDSTQAYKTIDSLPFVVYPYPPLYMLAARLANPLFGNQLMAGRIVSLLATLGMGLALALTVAFAAPPRTSFLLRAASGAFAGVLPFLIGNVDTWCSLMRVDMLALFLTYAGLGVFIVLGRHERWQYAAAILFVLALFTKQTMLSAPLACLAFGMVMDWKRTVRLGAVMAAFALAIVWILNRVTGGGFLTNILDYNINPFSWRAAIVRIYPHISDNWPRVAIAAAAFLGIWNIARIRRLGWTRFLQARSANPYSRAVLLAGLNSGLALAMIVSIGKLGATFNHFLLWDVSLCLLCGLFMSHLLAGWNSNRSAGSVTAVACAVLLLGLLWPPMVLLAGLAGPSPVSDDAEVLREIRQAPGPVLSENLTLLIEAGKPVEVEPTTIAYLALTGAWDEAPYVRLFDDRYFRLVVAYDIHRPDRYTPAVASAIERSYFRERRIGEYSIYRPNLNWPTPGTSPFR